MDKIPGRLGLSSENSDRAFSKLFIVEEKLLLIADVLQVALHNGRGGTSQAFAYKRLAQLCKAKIAALKQERDGLLRILEKEMWGKL